MNSHFIFNSFMIKFATDLLLLFSIANSFQFSPIFQTLPQKNLTDNKGVYSVKQRTKMKMLSNKLIKNQREMFYILSLQPCNVIKQYLREDLMDKNPPSGFRPITKRFSVNESRFLGKGCFGNVYEGYDNQTSKLIAVKHLNKPQNFEGEIVTLEKLSTLTHPYIMDFYGYIASNEDVYLFIEYCPGGVLTNLIKKGLEQQQVLDLFRQLVEGMCYMNAKDIMHRDLKPDNILLGSNKDVKISDFGLATIDDGLEKTSQMGTPLYAGPQIYINFTQDYNFNCDVWSAGLILHQMLTRTHPFDHVKDLVTLKKEWKLYEKGEKRIKLPKNLHPQWDYLVNVMLTFNFKKRPMFHQILQILKKLDQNGTMRQEIRDSKKGIKVQGTSNQPMIEVYLGFLEEKFEILADLAESLSKSSYPHIKESLKDLLIFLIITRYVVRLKNLIRSLKFKNLKYPNGKDVIDSKSPDNKIALIMDQYRNVFEVKLTKNQTLLKEKLIPKVSSYESSEEDMKMLKGAESAYKLFQETKEGTFDVEQTYEEETLKLLAHHRVKPTEEKLNSMTHKQHIVYAQLLLAGLLSKQIPDKQFEKQDFVSSKIGKIQQAEPGELLTYIQELRKLLG